MDATTLSDISSSMAEFLEKEKIYKELCRSITEGVSPHDISMSSPRDKSLTPDDEINALLKQMNQILSPDGKEDILGTSEERSVEVILKEAEDLIRSSTPLFVNISSGSSTKTWPPPQRKLTAPCNITQTITKADNSESLSDESESDINVTSKPNVEIEELEDNQQMANSHISDIALTTSSSTAKSGNRSNYSISEANDQIFKDIVNRKKRKTNTNRKAGNKFTKAKLQDQLLLSDLAIPSVESSKPSKNISPHEEPAKVVVRIQQEKVQGEANDFGKENATQRDQLKISYDEQTFDLKKQINVLNSKLQEYEHRGRDQKSEAETLVAAQQRQIDVLEAELRTQEQLIAGYQRENHKLCQEMSAVKEQWKQRESNLLEEKQQLQNELHGMMTNSSSEAIKEELKDAQETIVKLQLQLATSKSNNKELELSCDRLRGDVIRLEAEVINYRSHVADLNKRDDKTAATAVFATTTALSSQLTDARNVITRKDAEIVRLNTSLGTLRAELNKKQMMHPSNQSYEIETLNVTISQLQAALSLERDHSKELNREKDALFRETVDLKRQVRELEVIVKRRNRSESQIPLSQRSDRSDNRVRELEKELSVRQDALAALHSQLQNMQKKYEDHIGDLEGRLKTAQVENQTLKTSRSEHLVGSNRSKKVGQAVSSAVTAAVKEDAHLIATIRGLKQELAAKEKEIVRFNKELDDARKTNRRLQKEREKQLNPTPTHKGNRGTSLAKEVEKVSSLAESVGSTLSSAKSYNPLIFAEFQETMAILKSENKTLQTEVKRLEQDLITMHGKRVHDLNALQADHDLEIARMLNEHSARHSQSNVAELQGQVYTQQVVIKHLKQQLKQTEELKEETAMLRAERSHLEEALIELKKNLDSLKSLQSPESAKQESVLAMLETIKRNSEIREQKLQGIVRDLLSRTSQTGHCSSSCCEKLMDKNRQLCYYCAEMDKILEPLREFRRKK